MLELRHCLEYLEESREMGDVNTSYVSDHQTWMNEQLEKNPEWVEDQKAGRALWWDKKQDVDSTGRNAASKVPQRLVLVAPWQWDDTSRRYCSGFRPQTR